MRILVISDIHANLTALQAVLKEAGDTDATWCLGDLVGYGPDPNDCVDVIRSIPNLTCLIGNHDAAAIGTIDTLFFNREARLSAQWVKSQLSEENISFLKSLPEKSIVEGVTLVHGSPRNPVWEYLLDLHTAEINFSFFDTQLCLVGHTHVPMMFYFDHLSDIKSERIVENETVHIKDRMILNPGSVGQPRDRDVRASFAIFDPAQRTWEIHRIEYDIQAVQSRIINSKLPSRHAQRLAEGW